MSSLPRSPTFDESAFYRFSERFYCGLRQCPPPLPVYRAPQQWTCHLLAGTGPAPDPLWSGASGVAGPPGERAQRRETTRMRPAWPGRAAPPGPLLLLTPAGGCRTRGGAGRRRGRRAGRRLQRRRHRLDYDDCHLPSSAPSPPCTAERPCLCSADRRPGPKGPGAAHRDDIYTGSGLQSPDDLSEVRDSAIYRREQLLQLRLPAAYVSDPPPESVRLIGQLGLRRRSDACDRPRTAREIETVVTAGRTSRQMPTPPALYERCLVLPPRLTLQRTRRAGRGAVAAAAGAAKALYLGHLNVRSLTAHLDEVNDLLAAEKLDVLCLSESWLTDRIDSQMLQFPGYTLHRKDRTSSRTGGGVAILCHNSISVLLLQVPDAGSSLETMWLQLQVKKQPSVIVGVGYRPPAGAAVAAIDDLHHQLTRVLARDRPTYLLGDFNFDALQPTKPGVTGYLQLLEDLSLHQLVAAPTRPGNTPTLIDHLITNRPELTTNTRVVRCDISDHDLVTANIINIRSRHEPEIISVRPTRGVDQDALCLQLLLADWTKIDESETVAGKWDAFLNVWTPIIDLHMPVKQIKTRPRQYPWLGEEEVRQAMAARDRARARRDRHRSDDTQQAYRDSRNAVKLALNRASSTYYLTSFRNSRRKTWRDIRNFLVASGKAEPRVTPAAADTDWADKANRFFASVGPTVAESLSAADDGEPLPPRPPRVCSGAFLPRPATMPELSAALARMGTSRACGPDGITVQMLRTTFPVIAPQLLKLVNCAITSRELPAQWKQATVIPLHKKGDTGDLNNYRPISILSTVAKLCERVVCSQLMTYLSEQHVLCPEQYGFRPGLSTEAAMLDAVTFATDCVDSGHVAPLVTRLKLSTASSMAAFWTSSAGTVSSLTGSLLG